MYRTQCVRMMLVTSCYDLKLYTFSEISSFGVSFSIYTSFHLSCAITTFKFASLSLILYIESLLYKVLTEIGAIFLFIVMHVDLVFQRNFIPIIKMVINYNYAYRFERERKKPTGINIIERILFSMANFLWIPQCGNGEL